MKKSFWVAIVVLMAGLGLNAFADHVPGRVRPVVAAYDMKIADANFGFENVDRVDLFLTKMDGKPGYHGMQVALETDRGNRKIDLQMLAVERDSHCGSTRYIATLPGTEPNGQRFRVVLEDHTTRLCDDFRPYRWEASINEGQGWCGTFDSRMAVMGNPEFLMVTAGVR